MLYNKTTEVANTTIEPGTTFDFDWDSEAYNIERGTPVEVNAEDAVKAWLQLVLRTPQGQYAIYPTDFGASLYEIINKKLPKGAVLSEIRRQLQDSMEYCPTIVDIGQVIWDGEAITCTVTLTNDTTEVVTVEL